MTPDGREIMWKESFVMYLKTVLKLGEADHLEDPGVEVCIISKWVIKK
jgi:hypothetical protein